MKFNKENATRFGWNGIQGWALSSANDYAGMSTAYFEVDGSHGVRKSTLSDRAYYVLEGTGTFLVDEEKTPVVAGDVIIVPKNTWYDFVGEMKLFLVHAPAYDSKAGEHQKADLPDGASMG